MKEDLKVFSAGLVGVGASASNFFSSKLEPILHVLVSLGQVGVAVVTIIYIIAKIRAVRKSKKDDETKN